MTKDSPPAATAAPDAGALLAALERIERRLDALEDRLGGLGELAGEAPAVVATAVDGFDERVARLAERGVDVDERVHRALELVERLTEPATLEALTNGLALLKELPGTVATAVDTVDGVVARLGEAGVDVDARVQVVAQVAERLTAPEALAVVRETFDHADAIARLLRSGIFAPAAVDVVDRAAGALAALDVEGARPVGALGALRALKDPCIQRSLGALVEFGRRFGRTVTTRDAAGAVSSGPCQA